MIASGMGEDNNMTVVPHDYIYTMNKLFKTMRLWTRLWCTDIHWREDKYAYRLMGTLKLVSKKKTVISGLTEFKTFYKSEKISKETLKWIHRQMAVKS